MTLSYTVKIAADNPPDAVKNRRTRRPRVKRVSMMIVILLAGTVATALVFGCAAPRQAEVCDH